MPKNDDNSQTRTAKRFDGYPSSKFGIVGVEIKGVIVAEFTEVSGLEAEVEVFEYIEGGNNLFTHKLPGRVKFPNVVLKRGLTDSTDLWDWFHMIMYRTGEETKEPVERKNVSIVQYDESEKERRRWNLTDAYPVKWTGPSFKADDNAIAIEALELAHKGLSMQNP
jgi:phage tail-like protein